MRSIFFSIVLLGYTVNFSFAQEEYDTIAKKGNKCNTGIFISAGINSTQYYSDAFFSNLFDKTFSPVNGSPSGQYEYPPYSVNSNTFSRNINYYNKSSLSPIISMGLELGTGRFKKIKLNHIIYAGYTQISGNYSVSANYDEDWASEGGTPYPQEWRANVKGTIQSKYIQTAISLGYKFQPTYKYFFLSFGINCFFNLIKDDQHKTDYINGSFENAEPYYQFPYSRSNTSDITIKTHFTSFPFELGGGGYIKIKRIVLKPAFYFTPCFIKGYDLYNVSLGIGYSLKQ